MNAANTWPDIASTQPGPTRRSTANEALDDPDRVVITPDPASKSGRAVRTIGWSYTANRIIAVITLVDNGRLHGVNGWVANSSDQRLYREEDRDE